MIKTPVQLAVFGAIKSFCANGKRDCAISIRELARRSKVSNGWISTVINELITLDLVEVVGEEKRVGGTVPVYRVKCTTSETVKDNKVFTKQTLSVHPVAKSVHSSSTNPDKVKRKEKEESISFQNEHKDIQLVHEETKTPPEFADDIFNNWGDFKK